MKHTLLRPFIVLLAVSVLFSSCSESLLVSSGSTDNKPLIFNNEYETKKLPEISADGSAFWGIPTTPRNPQYKGKRGYLFSFNGVEIGRGSRVLPIFTMLGYTLGLGAAMSFASGYKKETITYYGYSYEQTTDKRNLPLGVGLLIAVPIAGTLNNLTWSNAAAGDASQSINYRLISENPGLDLFFYPKYDVTRSMGIWSQKASIKANVSGATLKYKSNK